MSYEGPSICDYCRRDQHCVWDGFGQMNGCACACPNPCHFSGDSELHIDSVCGMKWEPSAAWSDTNMWTHVTCPACLSLRPPDSYK